MSADSSNSKKSENIELHSDYFLRFLRNSVIVLYRASKLEDKGVSYRPNSSSGVADMG